MSDYPEPTSWNGEPGAMPYDRDYDPPEEQDPGEEELVWLLAFDGAVFGVFKAQEAGRAAMRDLRRSLGGDWEEAYEDLWRSPDGKVLELGAYEVSE